MAEQLNDLLENNQTKKTVTWEEDGKKHTKEIILQEPDARTASQIIKTMTGANSTAYFGEAMGIIMDNDVIVNPKLSYSDLNKKLEDNKKLAKKSVELVNADGKKVTLYMRFPDYRTAFNILMYAQKNDGSIDITGTMDLLFDNMLVDGNNKKLTWDWLDDHNKGYGLLTKVMEECMKYLSDVLNKDGVMAILMAAFQLGTKQINRVR